MNRCTPHQPVASASAGPRQRGFSLFELCAVIVIFSILIAYLLSKVFDNLEIAEKSAMETQRMMMRAGMDLHIAGLITAGREKELPRLRGSNPVEWLREPPANYLGAFPSEPERAAADGGWYFDTTARAIVYTPKRHSHLKPAQDGRYRVRFHVVTSSVNDPPCLSVITISSACMRILRSPDVACKIGASFSSAALRETVSRSTPVLESSVSRS